LPTNSTGQQLAAQVECRKRPGLQQFGNFCQLVSNYFS